MDIDEFINMQVSGIKSGFNHTQIRDEVYRYIFKRGIPNININALIHQCMETYAEIIKKELKL